MKRCGEVVTQTCWVIQARRPLREGFWPHAALQRRQQKGQGATCRGSITWSSSCLLPTRRSAGRGCLGKTSAPFSTEPLWLPWAMETSVLETRKETASVSRLNKVLKYDAEHVYTWSSQVETLTVDSHSSLASAVTGMTTAVVQTSLQRGIFIFNILPQSLECSCSGSLCSSIRGQGVTWGSNIQNKGSTSTGYDAYHV